MDDFQRLQEDLGFVRRAVDDVAPRSPAAIYFLWSVLMLCGFALADIRPQWLPHYWSAAGPLGGLASGYLGWRDQRITGQIDRATGMRWAVHWLAFLCAVFFVVLMGQRGWMSSEAIGAAILLLIAMAYFYAGLHLSPPLLWMGVIAAIGYLLVLSSVAYAWTTVGVAMAAASAFAGLQEWRSRAVA